MATGLLSLCSIAVAFFGSLYFFLKRRLRYLQFFQQEDYEPLRFFAWYRNKSAFDKKGSTAILAGILLMALIHLPICYLMISIFTAACLMFIARIENDPCTTGKIKLKITNRAKSILNVSLLLFYASSFLAVYIIVLTLKDLNAIISFWLIQLLTIQLHPLFLVVANWLLKPHESKVQQGFAQEAIDKLKKCDPMVIGITGSYGKTSTKVLLKEILGSLSPTFVTPGNINSYMGVTREIRERLKPEHKFAIVEMGAYYRGSIRKLCSLTPPKAAIVTAVGLMHLERFGSQEDIFLAKSELAQAVPADGILIVNGDYPYCRKMATENCKKTTLIYGLETDKGHLDATIHSIVVQDNGSKFKINWHGIDYEAFVELLGKPMLSNVLAAFTMACALGMKPEVAIAALRNVKPEPNRLEPVRVEINSLKQLENTNGQVKSGKILRLNDAYNSNPIGFASALDVLSAIPGKRKVLVTPGMIELGEKQDQENRKLAEKAAKICDLALVVGETNRKAILEGLASGEMEDEQHKVFETMQGAFAYLYQYCQDGDVVLIENDLPDLYEGVVSF